MNSPSAAEAASIPAEHRLDPETPPDDALLFVELLTGSANTECCWRTFSDQDRGEPGKNYDGPLRAIWPELCQDQLEGRGVFILPNAGGHRDADIRTIRATFLDSDGVSLAEVLPRLEQDGLLPHLICRREDAPDTQAHVYTLTDGLSPAEFTAVQRALAATYGTDPRVINSSRVMRLPGTFHLKPGKRPSRYTLEDRTFGLGRAFVLGGKEILAAVPRVPEPERPAPRLSSGEPVTAAMLRHMLRHIDPGLPRVQENGRPGWLAVISALYSVNVVTPGGAPDPDYDGRALALEWSRGDLWPAGRPENWAGDADVTGEWDYRARNKRTDLPDVSALINLARAGGYTGPVRVAADVFAGVMRQGEPQAASDVFGSALSINAASVKPRGLQFLWYPYLVEERINVLGGRGDGGKGLVAAHIAACVTTGRPFPDGERPRSGCVLWCETEDGIDDTMVHRLTAAGADLAKVEFTNPRIGPEELVALVRRLRPVLIVMSPLVSFLRGLNDINKETDVRAALETVQGCLIETGATLLGIMHLNKKSDQVAIDRLLGSVAFANFVRSVLMAAPEDGAEDTKRLVHAKHNNSPKGADWCYRPVVVGPNPRAQTVRLEWIKPDSNVNPDAMFDKRKPDDSTAAGWLVAYLQEMGKVESKIVLKDALDAGHSRSAIEQAKRRNRRVRSDWGAVNKRPVSLWYLAGYNPLTLENC